MRGSNGVMPQVLLVVVLVIGLTVIACCPLGRPVATPTPGSTPPPLDTGWYWKPGGLVDYSPSGVPDFDQKQDGWKDGRGKWSYCGPVAQANSLWWLDSSYEPSPVAPPTINDDFPLVQSYSAANWDDHHQDNVSPLVSDLSVRMDTDGLASGGQWSGTPVEKMHDAMNQYIMDRGLWFKWFAHVEKSPEFTWIVHELERCQDVVLLIGFWQQQTEGWVRVGGHYVTCAGVNADKEWIGISDPYFNNAELGELGRVLPGSHSCTAATHNDAEYVSHDVYGVVAAKGPEALWALEDYAAGKDISNFEDQNWAYDLLGFKGARDAALPVHAEIDYAVAVSPIEEASPTPTTTPIAVPTPTPTPTPLPPPVTPTPTAVATPSASPTPGTTPGVTPTPVATPTPVPVPSPTPSVQITGITSLYWTDGLWMSITVHPLSDYGLEEQLHDVHIYLVYYDDGEVPVWDAVFDEPLVPCQEYWFEGIPVGGYPPMNLDTGYVKLVWTGADGLPIGWSTSQPAP